MKYDINKVTPRPWVHHPRKSRDFNSTVSAVTFPHAIGRPMAVCVSPRYGKKQFDEHDAAHIVQCVNTNEVLVEALETVVEQLGATSRDEGEPTCVQGVRAALALARGEDQ